MTAAENDWRALLEAGVMHEQGRERLADDAAQIALAAECLARLDTLWPVEWDALLPEAEA